jgi:hypothetical protein
MAAIRKEFRSPRSADEVWAMLRRFEAVHDLARGFVAQTRMEAPGTRIVTFANGQEVRETLVSLDEAGRRLCYAITDHPGFSHYNAVAEVFEDDAGARFVWTVDFLPDEMAARQEAAMAAGAAAMEASLA